ncbi:hypothetical protein A5662_15195 [Mycobacteriaceae bacterium 1482268.1]|nr:hypothetical protein A5662_15195 [Mycobacteriaceae bacterium 1482268.1]
MVAACLLAAAGALFGASNAAADPEDLVPFCSGDQTPMDNNCKPSPSQVFTHDAGGANPQVGFGTNPDVAPIT